MKVEVAMNKLPDCVYVLVSEHQMFEFDDPKELHVLGVYKNYLDAVRDMKSLFLITFQQGINKQLKQLKTLPVVILILSMAIC